MKKSLSGLLTVSILCLLFSAHSAVAQNQDGKLGVGLMVGEPTGISLKYWQSQQNAIDGGLAWSLGQYDAVHLHADYLWHNYSVFDEVEEGQLPLFYGIGGRLIFTENDAVLGVRVPVGINYLFEESPVGLFLELAPTINLAPSTDFDIGGALGVRIYL
ncbi:hypothetical protein ACG2F4_00830 [Halalkalibaculum sp. DA3122]|uniref:hypothetical protein n=1 Tax=unclassified Halalkalibaculum TaxID=2964617 RepID=UPI00375432FF